MKKIIALIMCAVLLLCGAAAAETAEKENLGTVNVNGAFNIKCRLPEGYKSSILTSDNTSIVATIVSDDAARPVIYLSIAFNDEYTQDGVAMRLNDLSEEELALIRESFLDTAEEVEFSEAETAYGTKLMVVTGTSGENNYLDVYSIYNSYEVEVIVVPGDGDADRSLDENQIETVIDFLSEMDFEMI